MMARILGVVLGVALLAGAAPRAATTHGKSGEGKSGEAAKAKVLATPDETKWGPGPKSLPPGAELAVLDGDPGKKGLFVMRAKLPAGYKIAPHTHPRQERVTVISGKMQLGHGRTADEAKMTDLEAGSFFSLPPRMEHYVRVTEDTVIQLNGEGPWEINYVNPADDPRKAGSAGR
jgi:quercetin dioxygenase-like cupin family protein